MEAIGNSAMLLGAGLAAGALNVLAGGGSFLTLPLLIFMGLPPGVANATNRVGIVAQDLAAVWSFDRQGVLDRGALLWAALPATVGGGVGAWLSLRVADELFVKILAFLMIALSLASIWQPRPTRRGEPRPVTGPLRALRTAGFLLVGVYGGFVQAGVGFLFLGLTTVLRLDLVRGNAIKVLTILPMALLALILFAWNGRVEWGTGLVLAAGFVAGGLLGAHLTVARGHRWLRGFVTVTVVLLALKLLLLP